MWKVDRGGRKEAKPIKFVNKWGAMDHGGFVLLVIPLLAGKLDVSPPASVPTACLEQ